MTLTTSGMSLIAKFSSALKPTGLLSGRKEEGDTGDSIGRNPGNET